ncbi:MAG: hypothetical protein H7329_07845 [Opitutaceae bacterium]|nr:hypothetical protein [Cytophagales bacterium]
MYKENKLTSLHKNLISCFSFFRSNVKKEEGILLVQMVQDYEFAIRLASASKILSEKRNLKVDFYDVQIRWIFLKTYKPLFGKRYIQSPLVKIHRSFGGNIIFNCSDKFKDTKFIAQKLSAIKNNLHINGIDGILKLEFENILVGDLIYDTYLRFYYKPTIEVINEDVLHVIEVALHLFFNFEAFLQKNKVKVLLNTYVSYLQHGIPARICLHKNIDVYTIGSFSYVIQKLDKNYPFHSINSQDLKPEKIISPEYLNSAKEKFTSRFAGKLDAAVSYMRKSSFSSTPISPETVALFKIRSRNIVIYAHDFFDSPHINKLLQFPDLYQFLKSTLKELTDLKNTSVFIKAHPNGISGCKEITVKMVNDFQCDHFYILEEEVSNLNIVELRPDLVCTARGTVGPEMAYFEIPVVALFDNLYANFNFVHTCHDLVTYFSILKGEKKPEVDYDKEMIFSFYYQAFMERYPKAENHILALLSTTSKGDTFEEEYMKFILENKERIFSKEILELYN